MEEISSERVILLQSMIDSENGFEQFCNAICSNEHSKLRNVLRNVMVSATDMIDQKEFVDDIYDTAYSIAWSILIALENHENQLTITRNIRDELERGFGRKAYIGILSATIGAWLGCLFLGFHINLELLRSQSIEAAWTEEFQKKMREQWKGMDHTMKF